jgi:hypothetical protein
MEVDITSEALETQHAADRKEISNPQACAENARRETRIGVVSTNWHKLHITSVRSWTTLVRQALNVDIAHEYARLNNGP